MNNVVIHTARRNVEVDVKDLPPGETYDDAVSVRLTDDHGSTASIMGTLAGLESLVARMGNGLAEVSMNRHGSGTVTETIAGVAESVTVVHNDPLMDLLSETVELASGPVSTEKL